MSDVISFASGDAVPEWLIEVTPLGPNATRDVLRFQVETDVIETPAYYMVYPTRPGEWPSVFSFGGAGNYLAAATKPVVVCHAAFVFGSYTLPVPENPKVWELKKASEAPRSAKKLSAEDALWIFAIALSGLLAFFGLRSL